jgi:hypothetical protein
MVRVLSTQDRVDGRSRDPTIAFTAGQWMTEVSEDLLYVSHSHLT